VPLFFKGDFFQFSIIKTIKLIAGNLLFTMSSLVTPVKGNLLSLKRSTVLLLDFDGYSSILPQKPLTTF
jgi:hypothetical protein